MRHSSTKSAAVVGQPPSHSEDSNHRARVLTRRALMMIPGTLVSALAAFFVGNLLMHATGTPEGTLLTSSGFAGWVSWVVVILLMMSAPLAGVILAVLARRAGDDHRSTIALSVNALFVAGIIFNSVANLFA